MSNKALYKPVFWRSFFLLLSCAYLVPEMIFNAQLVSLIGLGTPNAEDLERLEIYGRAVSGIGVSLLLADLLPARFYAGIFRGSASVLMVFAIAWPSVYFGQKILVEEFLVKPSTAEERAHALASATLRDALAIGGIEIADLVYQRERFESPDNLTFLALFGGLLYADDRLAETIDDQVTSVIRTTVKKKAYANFDQDYREFGRIYEMLSVKYKEYAEGSNKYNSTIASIGDREQEYWRQVEQEVSTGWSKYQEADKAFVARAEGRAQKYGPKIYEYHDRVQNCIKRYDEYSERDRKSRCINKLNANYNSEIRKLGMGYIEPDYWLVVEDVSTTKNVLNTIIGGVLSGGATTALQALDLATGGDGGFSNKRYKYTKNPAHYQRRILEHPKFYAEFEKETGYPHGINSLVDFRIHSVTQDKVRKTLKRKGLTLQSNWNIGQRAAFTRTVAEKVKGEADKGWKEEIRKTGYDLPPNLRWTGFQLHPAIQREIKKEMGENYVKNVKSDWSEKDFKRYVVDPNINKKVQRIKELVSSSVDLLADGGKYEEDGKQALRSVVVPPISMALSLFLICLTIMKLPLKILEAIKPRWKQAVPKGLPALVSLAIPVLLLVLPVSLSENRFTEDAKGPVNFFLNKIDESNPAMSYALRWTLHAQPILHPAGTQLEKATGLYASQFVADVTQALAAKDTIVFEGQHIELVASE